MRDGRREVLRVAYDVPGQADQDRGQDGSVCPGPSIPCSQNGQASDQEAKTAAIRAGSLTETLESRRLSSYHGSLSVWRRAIGEMSDEIPLGTNRS